MNLFQICDGAYNYNGQLTIVGTFERIKAAQIPFRRNIGVAIKATREADELAATSLIVGLTDNAGVDIMPEINIPLSERDKNSDGKVIVAVTINNVLFKAKGVYKLTLFEGHQNLAEYEFDIV